MNPPGKHDPWSFNHRTRAHAFDSDSESESEAEINSKVNIPSDDTRLIQELDISLRYETVKYKPNPWSIARINAASRPPNKEPPGQVISEDMRRKPQPRVPRGRIMNAFKIRAERQPPRASRPLKALKVNPKPNAPRVPQEHQVCSQIQRRSSAEPGDYLQHDNASFSPRESQTRPSDVSAILSPSASHDLRVQPHPGALTLSCTPDIKHSNIRISHEALLQRSAAHISTPDMSLIPQYNVRFMSMSSPLTSRDYPVNTSHRLGGYQSSPPRPFHRNINTPPRLLPCKQSPSHFRQGACLTGNQCFRVVSALPVSNVPMVGSHRTVPPAMVEVEPPSMPQWLASTIHNSLNPPLAQAEYIERVSSPEASIPIVNAVSIATTCQKVYPETQYYDLSVPLGDRHISAYAFDDDPDVNWSTIMKPKKKSNKFQPNSIQSSGPFSLRLPGIAVGSSKNRSMGVAWTEKKLDTQTKRRVITYLPPPLQQRTVAQIENSPQIEEHYVPDDDALPSVPTSTAQPPQESGRVSPLPLADSDDLTLVGGVDEQVIQFDAGEVKARYPKVRKLIKEPLVAVLHAQLTMIVRLVADSCYASGAAGSSELRYCMAGR
ncbi:hypothetical protein BDR04DRAFT_1233729 [Suillus decipiens]|nr:hypothetical protein BDR04DRAFT_1233729 [Suillus decipiens]